MKSSLCDVSDVTPVVHFPAAGVIRVVSPALFADPDGDLCRRFLGRTLLAREIETAEIESSASPRVDLRFNPARFGRKRVLRRVADLLSSVDATPGDALVVAPASTARDHQGVVRYRRCANRVTGWRVDRANLSSLRLSNPVLYRKSALTQAIERELMSVLGVRRYDTDSRKCRVDIEYDPRHVSVVQLIEILDGALAGAEHPETLDKLDRNLTLCAVSLPLAAAAQFAVPALLPVSGALFFYTTLPSFKRA